MQIPRPIAFAVTLIALLVIYIAGIHVDVMDVDGSQYASISLEMLQNGEYLQVQHLGQDYLDKPPLLFWASALAFKIFGINNWSHKLFPLFFSVLAAYSTYRFAKRYYSRPIAIWSGLMMASCQSMFLMNIDVRTDTMLVGAVIFSVWQITDFLHTGRWVNLLGISVGIALAMLAKGPIGLMVPVLAFGSDWFLKRQWHHFFRWQWLFVVALVLLLLSPMLYGLYKQYGGHGPYFYFWAQSFGRITGDNPFINSGAGKQPPSPFFFMHTFLWAFLPWSFLAVRGLMQGLGRFFKGLFYVSTHTEVVSLWGFILPFIAVSLSDYKLPHYIYVILPFAAVLAARYAISMASPVNFWRALHQCIAFLLLAFTIALGSWAFPQTTIWVWIGFAILAAFALFHLWKHDQWLVGCLMATLAANLIVATSIYPQLLQYQTTGTAGRHIASLNPTNTLSIYARGHALDFYAQQRVPYYESIPPIAPNTIIYTNVQGMQELKAAGHQVTILHTYQHYKVTALTWGFINPANRENTLQKRYLLMVQ